MRSAPPTPLFTVALPEDVTAGLQRAESAERRGEWAAAREHYGWVLATLPAESEPSFTARLIRQIARCHIEAADFEAALDSLELARSVAAGGGDKTGVAHAINLIGIAELQRGNVPAAEVRYLEARAIAEQVGADAVIAMVSQNLGVIANTRGDYEAAREHYEMGLAAYERLGMFQKIGPLLNNLGMLYTDLREWRSAERAFSQAMARSTADNDIAGLLQAQANRVELYLYLGRFRKARRECRSVLRRVAGGAHGQWIGETYKHLGVVSREMGNGREAAAWFTRALDEAAQRQGPLLEAETQRELAVLHRREGRTQETLTALNRSHEIFTKLTARGDLSDIDKRLRTLETSFLEIVRRWGSSIESKDRYTQGHCERVAEVGCLLATDAGVPDDVLLWFRMGGLLHDVGKVMVPEEVLNKAGQLTPDEWLLMKEHPAAGERLVAGANFPLEVMPMIRHHHERWDGNGYPDQLAGEATPFWARILCIADVFDALTTTRSYRKAFSIPEAVTIMRSDSGRAFDPSLLAIFLERTLPKMEGRRPRASGSAGRVVGHIALAV
jgi:HD-GYP domain-containing protein (c-di-GMP phosphodiesterase class II)